MAYIKIFPIKSTVNKAMKYITNADKTDDQKLVSSFGCSPETAELEFAMTREAAKKMIQDRETNLARHLIISFKPGEISDPKLAHEIGTKIADEVLKGKYEYVISTHVDKKHCHCHIIFNDVSFVDYHRYRSNKRTYHKLCQISNKICRQYGLTESMPNENRSRKYKENMEFNNGTSWKKKLQVAVDKAIRMSVTFDEFLLKMQEAGYEIRQGKYLAFRAPEQKHFTNVKSLGSYYTDEKIRNRIEQNRLTARVPINATVQVRMYAEMAVYIRRNDRPGFDYWSKLNNLKESAKTFNYLSQNKLLNYEDFQNHIADVKASIGAAGEKISQTEKALSAHKTLTKRIDTYRHCREIVLAEKSASDPAAYRRQHKNEYQLHEMIRKELSDQGITKLPSAEKLLRQQQQLEEELAAAKKEKQDLQKKERTLQVIESNFDTIVREAKIHVPAVEKKTETKAKEQVI